MVCRLVMSYKFLKSISFERYVYMLRLNEQCEIDRNLLKLIGLIFLA